MEEESSPSNNKESKTDISEDAGGGDSASDLPPLTEADSRIGLLAPTKCGDGKTNTKRNRTSLSQSSTTEGKDGQGPTLTNRGSVEESGVELSSNSGSLLTSEDVDMSPADSSDLSVDAANTHKRVRLTPPGDNVLNATSTVVENGGGDAVGDGDKDDAMSVDTDDNTDDTILNMDQLVEDNGKSERSKVRPGVVELQTVLGDRDIEPDTSTTKSRSSSLISGQGTSGVSSGKTSNKNGPAHLKKNKTSSKDGLKEAAQTEKVDTSAADASSSMNGEEDGGDGSGGESDRENAGVEVFPPDQLPVLSTDSDDETLESDDEGAGVVNPDLLSAAQRRMLHRRRVKDRLFGRRRRRHGRLSSSSDSDDSLENITDDEPRSDDKLTGNESDNEEEVRRVVQEVLGKPMPKPNWFALRELRKREYCASTTANPAWFREGVQASLQMTRRLVVVDKMQAHEGCVNALCFNRIGTLLASGSDDLDIVLWNWQKGRASANYFSGHRSNVFQAKFMPFSGDCHVISCARDGQVRVAELNSSGVCKDTRKLAQHRGAAHKLALEYDSPHVFLSCGEDALTFMFDLRQEKPNRLVTAKENEKKVPLYSIHSNPSDSNEFCVGGRDHYIRVFDKRKIAEQLDGGVLKKLCPDHLVTTDLKANVTCACYNYNGSEILGTYNDEDIYLFDNTMSDGANYIHKYTGHRNNATVKGVNFYGPRSEYIISGSDCGNLYFWEKETEAIINFQEGDETGVINVVEPHPSLPVMATSGLDHDVKLWMPSLSEPNINSEELRKTMKKNQVERNLERVTSEPEFGGQMLWFIMHHFQNSVRRRMRNEDPENASNSDDDEEEEEHSDDSESNRMQCAQS